MMTAKKLPLRQCTGCREMKEKKALIRVIRTMEGEILLDATGRKNGRGAYLCPCADCLQKARKTKGLERTLKSPVPEGIYEKLMEEIGAL